MGVGGGCIGGCAQACTSQNVSMGVCVCRYINVNMREVWFLNDEYFVCVIANCVLQENCLFLW